MKPILTLSVLLLIGAPLATEAREGAHAHGPDVSWHGPEGGALSVTRLSALPPQMREAPRPEAQVETPQRLFIQQRYSIDEAINLVEQRTGGRYVSGSQTGPSTFIIKVQIGPNIVTYRVDLSNRSMSKA